MRIFPSAARCRRMAVALSVLAVVLGFYIWRTWWSPALVVRTAHYVIRSTATPAQTEQVGRVLEALHDSYADMFSDAPQVARPHDALVVKLYRDRAEFRRCNPTAGWAEAFYRRGCCHAYYSADEPNPCHWMLHEAVHQLNRQVAGFRLARWIDEGLATYFGTSRYRDGALLRGQADRNAYPVWWLSDLELSGALADDIRSGEIIPLRTIVSGRGGPDIDVEFNRYYIHWWTLTHFLIEYEDGRYRDAFLRVVDDGGGLDSFEKHLGPVDAIQNQWYEYLKELRRTLSSTEPGLPPRIVGGLADPDRAA